MCMGYCVASTASLQRGHLRNFPFPLHSVSQCSFKAAISTTCMEGRHGQDSKGKAAISTTCMEGRHGQDSKGKATDDLCCKFTCVQCGHW